MEGVEDLAGLLEYRGGFAGSAECDKAAAVAEEGEGVLGNNPERLPALRGVGVAFRGSCEVALGFGESGVRGGEGVFVVGGQGFDTADEPPGEFRNADAEGGAHDCRQDGGVARALAEAGGAVDLGEQGGRRVVLSECGTGRGR